MNQRLQVWNERRTLLMGALTSKVLARSVLALIALGLVALVVDRHVTHAAGNWKIFLYCVFGVSMSLADEVARARGKQYSAFNVFYFGQFMLWCFGYQYPEFSASSPVIAILWCAAIFACGIASGFVSTKDRVAIVFDARDPLSLSSAALAVVICAVFFGLAWWSRNWFVGSFSAAGVALVFGVPLILLQRQKLRTAASGGLGIQA